MSDNAAPLSPDAVAFADRIGELLTNMRAAEAELGALLVEIEQREVMELFGYRSAARLLEHLADIPKSAAERVVKRARLVNPGRNLDGSPIPALAPATGAAALSGRLSNPMIDVITGVLADVPLEHRDSAETDLLTFTEEAGHKQVAALGARILAHLTPDGTEPTVAEPTTPARELFLRRKRSGTWELNATFDDETGTRASALLDALAERRTGDDGPDIRTLPQRYGDAFSDAVDLALDSPDLPMQAGERAHVMVAVSLEDLKAGVGTATLGDTGTLSAAEARVHACDSMIIPAVLGEKSEPLNLGRLRRRFTGVPATTVYRQTPKTQTQQPPRTTTVRSLNTGGPAATQLRAYTREPRGRPDAGPAVTRRTGKPRLLSPPPSLTNGAHGSASKARSSWRTGTAPGSPRRTATRRPSRRAESKLSGSVSAAMRSPIVERPAAGHLLRPRPCTRPARPPGARGQPAHSSPTASSTLRCSLFIPPSHRSVSVARAA